jgi:hypothetical protein
MERIRVAIMMQNFIHEVPATLTRCFLYFLVLYRRVSWPYLETDHHLLVTHCTQFTVFTASSALCSLHPVHCVHCIQCTVFTESSALCLLVISFNYKYHLHSIQSSHNVRINAQNRIGAVEVSFLRYKSRHWAMCLQHQTKAKLVTFIWLLGWSTADLHMTENVVKNLYMPEVKTKS